MSNKIAVVIFQTKIGDDLAQTEVQSDVKTLNTRAGRKAAEETAIESFKALDPRFERTQTIKAVDIQISDLLALRQ